jgi:ERCC4-type nuclease
MPSPTPKAVLEKFDCAVRVDDRAGSKDLVPYLERLGLTVRLERLPAGDIELIGIDGTVVLVEYKQWSDVLACVRSGRFAEQLRGMRREAHVSWLLVEGSLRVGPKGELSTLTDRGWREVDAGVTAPELDSWLLTMAQCGGALLWRTQTSEESAYWLRALYYWWTFQNWAEHRAHKAWFVPPPLWENPYAEPPLALKVACLLPGIGNTRANALIDALGTETHYPSAEEVTQAGTGILRQVPGIGKTVATRVWEAWRTREKRDRRRSRAEKGTRAGEARG